MLRLREGINSLLLSAADRWHTLVHIKPMWLRDDGGES